MVKPSSPPRYEHHLSARIRKKLGVEQLPEELRAEPTHQGPRRKLLGWQLIAGMVAQNLHACGSLQQIIGRYFAVRIRLRGAKPASFEDIHPSFRCLHAPLPGAASL
ncbi:MAG: hypothetical protein IPK32_09755 [Verrucomicrobiaceae bacterium]|nr:hypothetical protein [Verrucomicrobiaceae bacterium]